MKNQTYEVFNHQRVWQAARCNIDMLDKQFPGDFMEYPHFALAGMVLAFFAFEGYLNWLGALICPDIWPENERSFFKTKPYNKGTISKMKYLAKRLELGGFDLGKRPWGTVAELQTYRDKIAHPKPEKGSRQVKDHSLMDGPPKYTGILEAQATSEKAKMCRDDIEQIANQFHAQCLKLHPEKTPKSEPFSGLLAFSSTER